MAGEYDMLKAISTARSDRLKRQTMRFKVIVILLLAAATGVIAAAWALHANHPSAQAAEMQDRLSIHDAIMEAVDDYGDFPEVDWDHWLSINPNVVGWLTLSETGIDHPIVMADAENPTYYLSHALDGASDPKGCIFLDAECAEGLDSMHCVVYGHNYWTEGCMFADLAKYGDPGFADEHRTLLLQTPDWKKRLEVQCVEIANGADRSNVISFESIDSMETWYAERYQASNLQLGQTPGSHGVLDSIFTFCTCVKGANDKRVLVYATPEMNARAASRDSASTA